MNSDTDTHHSPIIIAIDGFSSSGKSSMARRLAHDIGYRYIDSGAMYRAVTLYALRHGMVAPDGSIDTAPLEAALPSIEIDFAVTPQGQATLLNGEDVERQIRSMEVSAHVSPVAAIPAVRRALVALQQAFGRQKGIVMDGRDIGTTVFPHAEMKVYVNAPAETRARRRYKELEEKGALGSTTLSRCSPMWWSATASTPRVPRALCARPPMPFCSTTHQWPSTGRTNGCSAVLTR